MKGYLFLFPLLLLLASPAPAQQVEFAPAGAEWFYSYHSGWSSSEGFFHAQSLGDTLLDGRVCKKICTSYYARPATPPYCNAQSLVRYLYQNADSIFEYRPAPASDLQLLFRTNFQVGDSMHYLFRSFVVASIDTLILNNQPVRQFHLGDGFGTQFIVYDRFGPQDGLFDYSWGIIADGAEFHLRCYQENNFPQVHLSTEACDFVLATEAPLSSLYFYPNPAHDFIYFLFRGDPIPELSFQIWDAAGRLVRDHISPVHQAIEVQTLPAGFYVLAIKAGEARAWQKFVKQ